MAGGSHDHFVFQLLEQMEQMAELRKQEDGTRNLNKVCLG